MLALRRLRLMPVMGALLACAQSGASKGSDGIREGRLEQRARSSEACAAVEAQAVEANAGMPRRLDADTVALQVKAHDCHVTFEYGMPALSVEQLRSDAMERMREVAVAELCADVGARSAMEFGGSFTSIYWGAADRRLGRFTVEAGDCTSGAPPIVARAAAVQP